MLKGLVLLKLLPPALAAGYQAWHSVWSSEALLQQMSKVDSVDFSSLRMNIMNYVGVWLLSHAHRGQWLWCALFDFVTLSLVVFGGLWWRFCAIPWDFPWSSSATDPSFLFTEVLVLAFTLPPLSQNMPNLWYDKRWHEMTRVLHWKYTDDLSRKMLKTHENSSLVFFICGILWLQWDAMSLWASQGLACLAGCFCGFSQLRRWLQRRSVRVSKPQPFPGRYLKPTGVVSDGIFHSRALASYFDAGSLSHSSTLKTSRQGGSASRSCLNLIRCSSMFPDVPGRHGTMRQRNPHRFLFDGHSLIVSHLSTFVRRQIDTTSHDLIWLRWQRPSPMESESEKSESQPSDRRRDMARHGETLQWSGKIHEDSVRLCKM